MMFFKEKRKSLRIRNYDENAKVSFQLNGKEYTGELFDYSRFGIGIILPKARVAKFPKVLPVTHVVVSAFGKIKELGDADLVRIRSNQDSVFLGLYLKSEFVDMDFLVGKQTFNLQEDEIKKIRMNFLIQEKISSEFLQFVSRFVFGLSLYKISLDELDSKFYYEPTHLKQVLFEAVCNGIGKDLYQFLSNSIEQLKNLTARYSKAESEVAGFFLRKSIFRFILEADFLKRTNLRPNGYQGDSVMMEMIYQNEYLGTSTFGKIFHKHALETSAACAVRNRRKLINQVLIELLNKTSREIRVLSVACGPAFEVLDFFEQSPHKQKVKFFLLDQDEEALKKAEERIGKFESGKYLQQCHFIQESVRTLLKTKDPELILGKFDFIYSMGLYDYLADTVAKALIVKFFQLLEKGGELLIGNYHEKNETRKYMEYIMDWTLYYRDEDSMLELVKNIPEPLEYNLSFEESGNQMFLHIKKI